MGLIFLIIFALAEIALVVLTFTRFGEKAAWLKNRAVIRTAEAALMLGIILVPATNLKWRFFFAMGILAVRFLFAGIMWLIKRNKATGKKKKAGSVVDCIVSIMLIAFALVPSFIFANYGGLPTTGEFNVGTTDAILVDESRPDTFENDGSFREVPVHFFYPENAEGSFPLVVFSHGAFGYYQSNFSTYRELASNGYVVVALDHPHHAFFTKDTDGKIITVDQDFINEAMVIGGGDDVSNEEVYEGTKSWMELRIADGNFVLNTIEAAKKSGTLGTAWHSENSDAVLNVLAMTDTDKIGCMGHSLGGATGIALGRERDDIDAVIDFDGTVLGEVVEIKNGKCVPNDTPYPVPVLVFSNGENVEEGAYVNITGDFVNNAKDGKLVTFKHAGHMDFTDLPLLSPFLGSMLGHGNIDTKECMTKTNEITLEWLNYYLKNEGTLDFQAQY